MEGISSSFELMSMNNPYYLHPSDSPNNILVSTPLTEDNYMTWCQGMTMALRAKNKFCFVNGMIPKPLEDDTVFPAWNKVNRMVLSWILQSLHEGLIVASNYTGSESAEYVWNDLRDQFSPSSGLRVFALQHAIAMCRQGNDPVAIYFCKLKDFWDKLSTSLPTQPCSCGATINYNNQVQRLMQFLMGLRETYASIQKNILLMNPLPPVNDAYALVLQEESQSSVKLTGKETAQDSRPGDEHTTTNEIESHHKFYFCAYCNISDHTIDNCPKLYGSDLTEGLKGTKDKELEHFYHKHILKFSDKRIDGIDLCSGCNLSISEPNYSCRQCKFVLHKKCAEAPRELLHPNHSQHPLTLLLESPYHTRWFGCDSCNESGKGLHYHCTICPYDLHVHCASFPDEPNCGLQDTSKNRTEEASKTVREIEEEYDPPQHLLGMSFRT